MENNEGFEKTVLIVKFDVENNVYKIGACQGSSVNEMAFAVMTIAKVLKKGGYIKDVKDFIELIEDYCNDAQYDELEE